MPSVEPSDSAERAYQISVVRDDLRFLREEWDHEISDASLRRSSGTLRMLLVEDGLGRAWRASGRPRQPKVHALDLDAILQGEDLERISFATAGGARYRGMTVQGGTVRNYAMTPEQVRASYERGRPVRDYWLTEFRDSTAMVVNGIRVSRGMIVKYVANRLGGVHLDSGAERHERRAYRTLDRARASVAVADKNSVFFELLSIGQTLVSAPDVQALMGA